MLSEGSSVRGSAEDKQASGSTREKCQDFTVGPSGTLHRVDTDASCKGALYFVHTFLLFYG